MEQWDNTYVLPFPATAHRDPMSSPLTLAPLAAPANRIDHTESLCLARALRAGQKNCYLAALSGVQPDRLYVEGLVVRDDLGMALEYAWLERDDTVIDPMLELLDPNHSAEWHYFAAFRWTFEEVLAQLDHHGGSIVTPIRQHLPYWGHNTEGWLDATLRAHRHIAALHPGVYGSTSGDSADERKWLQAIIGRAWLEKLGTN